MEGADDQTGGCDGGGESKRGDGLGGKDEGGHEATDGEEHGAGEWRWRREGAGREKEWKVGEML